MGAVRTAYTTAITALESYRDTAYNAQPSTSAIKHATLADAAHSASEALAKIKGDMNDERTGNRLTTLGL